MTAQEGEVTGRRGRRQAQGRLTENVAQSNGTRKWVRDRGAEIQRDGQRKSGKTEIPRRRGRNEDRDREVRFGEAEIEVGQRPCDRKR